MTAWTMCVSHGTKSNTIIGYHIDSLLLSMCSPSGSCLNMENGMTLHSAPVSTCMSVFSAGTRRVQCISFLVEIFCDLSAS